MYYNRIRTTIHTGYILTQNENVIVASMESSQNTLGSTFKSCHLNFEIQTTINSIQYKKTTRIEIEVAGDFLIEIIYCSSGEGGI
jgi:hypothetical protein